MRRVPLLSALVFAVLAAPPAQATPPGSDGDIYFATYEQPQGAIARIAPGGGTREIVLDGPTGSDPAVSPDGTRIAYSRDSDIWVVPTSGGTPERLTTEDAEPNYQPAWSPDGKRIAYIAQEGSPTYRLETIDVATKGDIEVLVLDARPVLHPSWSPDGTTLLFTRWTTLDPGAQPQVHAVERSSQNVYVAGPVPSSNPDWAPDGRSIVYEVSDGGQPRVEIGQITTASGTRLPHAAQGPVFSPSGGAIAVQTTSGTGRIARIDRGGDGQWGTADDSITPLSAGTGYGDRSPSWAGTGPVIPPPSGGNPPPPGGSGPVTPPAPVRLYPGRIFFDAGHDETLGEIYSILPGGGDLRRLTNHRGIDGDPDVSRPVAGVEQRVAFTRAVGRRTEIWVMRPDGGGQRPYVSLAGLARAEDASWGPDGRSIAFAGRSADEERTSIFVSNGNDLPRRLTTEPGPRFPVQDSAPSFSPDGTLVAFRRVGADWLPRLCTVALATGNIHCTPTAVELARRHSGCEEPTGTLCELLWDQLTVASARGLPTWSGTEIWSTAGATGRRDNGTPGNPFLSIQLPYGVYADDENLERVPILVDGIPIGPSIGPPAAPGPPQPALIPRLVRDFGEPVPRYAAPGPDGAALVTLGEGEDGEHLAVGPLPATTRPSRITPPLTTIGLPSWQAVTTPLGSTALGTFRSRVSVGLNGARLRGGTLRTAVRNRENFAVDGELRISRGGAGGARSAGARCTGRRRAKFFVAAKSSVRLRVKRVARGSRACLILRDRRGGRRSTPPARLR